MATAVASAIALVMVGLAGAALGMKGTFDAYTGASQLLFAFESAVIGGTGSVWGTLLGGIVLALAQSIGATISPLGFLIAGHAVFLAVLFVRIWLAGGVAGLLRRRA
jgi:branched-chain amino acid transport system permease protein